MPLLQVDAEKICTRIKAVPNVQSSLKPCCLCGESTSFKVLTDEPESVKDSFSYSNLNLATRDNVKILTQADSSNTELQCLFIGT